MGEKENPGAATNSSGATLESETSVLSRVLLVSDICDYLKGTMKLLSRNLKGKPYA
jgi:hypothetical protein